MLPRLTLLPTTTGDALLIFDNGSAKPPAAELAAADVAALQMMCGKFLDWRASNAPAPEQVDTPVTGGSRCPADLCRSRVGNPCAATEAGY